MLQVKTWRRCWVSWQHQSRCGSCASNTATWSLLPPGIGAWPQLHVFSLWNDRCASDKDSAYVISACALPHPALHSCRHTQGYIHTQILLAAYFWADFWNVKCRRIQAVPRAVREMAQLRVLDLSGNQLALSEPEGDNGGEHMPLIAVTALVHPQALGACSEPGCRGRCRSFQHHFAATCGRTLRVVLANPLPADSGIDDEEATAFSHHVDLMPP